MSVSFVTDEHGIKVYSQEVEWSGGTFKKYSVGINKKDRTTGEWLTVYQAVKFGKGVEVNNKALIRIKDSFPNMYKGKDGKVYLEWFIKDFEVLENGDAPADAPANDSFMNVPVGEDSELPFV